MGTCSSCGRDSTSVAVVLPTAKLILQDGQLQEFSYPIKVRHVLPKGRTAFICHSDDIGVNDVVSAMSQDDELRLGHLYFALPLERLRSPLRSEEMAALAARASSALMKDQGGKYRCCQRQVPVVAEDEVAVAPRAKRGRSGGSGRRRSFTSNLSSILE